MVYFLADDGITGYELWKYDGTNVSQVADINPGYSGSLPMPMKEFNGAFYFNADDGLHGNELWRVDSISDLVRLTIKSQGNDISLTWTTPGGMTNILQAASGGLTNNFVDRSTPILSPTGGVVTLNYLDIGGATNSPSQFYRVRLEP